jgi:hypothetical protein
MVSSIQPKRHPPLKKKPRQKQNKSHNLSPLSPSLTKIPTLVTPSPHPLRLPHQSLLIHIPIRLPPPRLPHTDIPPIIPPLKQYVPILLTIPALLQLRHPVKRSHQHVDLVPRGADQGRRRDLRRDGRVPGVEAGVDARGLVGGGEGAVLAVLAGGEGRGGEGGGGVWEVLSVFCGGQADGVCGQVGEGFLRGEEEG